MGAAGPSDKSGRPKLAQPAQQRPRGHTARQVIRQALRGEEITPVPLVEVYNYIERLWQTPTASTIPERARVSYLKMFLNYIALSVDTEGDFLRLMRRTQTEVELFNLCDRFLLSDMTKTLALAPCLIV